VLVPSSAKSGLKNYFLLRGARAVEPRFIRLSAAEGMAMDCATGWMGGGTFLDPGH
jgi:hypothetical protein